MNQTAEKILEAYGGRELWENARSVEVEFSAHGLAFSLKRRTTFSHARCVVAVAQPEARTTPIGDIPGITGTLIGPDTCLETAAGKVIQKRRNARIFFPGGRRLFFWDDLDMSYFCNYAMWNYLTFPALLLRPDMHWTELEPGCLAARFPKGIPTHSVIQHFTVDMETGFLRRHTYTAEVIGNWARAVHIVRTHEQNKDGIWFTSERRVTPALPNGKPAPFPTLISIIIHDHKIHT